MWASRLAKLILQSAPSIACWRSPVDGDPTADNAFTGDNGCLDLLPRSHDGEHRNHPALGEIDVRDWRSDRVKELAQPHADPFEIGSKPFKIADTKPIQEPVLPYVSRIWHIIRSRRPIRGRRPRYESRGTLKTRLKRRRFGVRLHCLNSKRHMPGTRQTVAAKARLIHFWNSGGRWRESTVSEAKNIGSIRESPRRAFEAETTQLRDQLLDLARVWTEAATREEINVKRMREDAV